MKHEQEIQTSRVGGLGGSDAALIARAASCNTFEQLPKTYQHRLAVALGLTPFQAIPTTPAMQAGHDFEDDVAPTLQARGYDREVLLEQLLPDEGDHPEAVQLKDGGRLRLFAHADFASSAVNPDGTVSVFVQELKCSKFSTDVVADTYRWQLQWYYWLGAQAVMLMHKNSVTGDVHVTEVQRDEPMQRTLTLGVKNLPNLCAGAKAPAEAVEVDFLALDFDDMAEMFLKVKNLTKEINSLQDELKVVKEELEKRFLEENITTVKNNECSITYTPPTYVAKFDTKSFKFSHEDLYKKYTSQVERAGGLRVTFKKKDNA